MNEEIKSTNETMKFTPLRGVSGIFAGIMSLLGIFVLYLYFDSSIFQPEFFLNFYLQESISLTNSVVFVLSIFTIVLIISILGIVYFKMRQLKAASIWNKNSKSYLTNLVFPLIIGGLFSMVLIFQGQLKLVPATTMIFYGLALINIEKYTVREIRWFGFLFSIFGLLAALFIQYSIVLWTMGFGIMHIIWGFWLYLKYTTK